MKKGRTKTQICEVTGDEFVLSAEHLEAYEFFDLPLPTVSPEERLRLQLAFRNDHKLFKRTCSMTDKELLSVFGPQAPFPVVSIEYWRSEQWNPLLFGRNFDFNQLFVEQLLALWWTVPRPAYTVRGELACQAINLAFDLRNCAYVFNARACADCMYSVGVWHCEKCIDCYALRACQSCYECMHCAGCRDVYWSTFSTNCEHSRFLANCSNCKHCLFCANLEGKEYHVFNKPVTKEEFVKIYDDWQFSARTRVERAKEEFGLFLLDKPLPALVSEKCENVTGNYLYQCKDSQNCYECFNSGEILDCNQLNNAVNCLDGLGFGDGLNDSAQFVSVGGNGQRIINCVECWNNVADLTYCTFCESSQHLFACIGLRNKEYCIFNKQFTKEHYHAKRASIITFLKQRGIWGKFFPAQFSGHAYNHSSASLYMPLGHVTAKMMGFRWDDMEASVTPQELLSGSDLPPEKQFSKMPIRTEDLDRQAISSMRFLCEMSGAPYKILESELQLYRVLNLPPPARAFETRHAERVAGLSGRRLIVRKIREEDEMVSAFGANWHRPILPVEDWERMRASGKGK